ncbi:MAG: hypothetical protein R3293_20520 [Candidatus Promineifilaceae bacterium]|nr:hypothetical protein [Candidatus Promineifilaceae bacterium]
MQDFGVSFTLQTPILFLAFNRPDTTHKVFNVIRQVKPPRLYAAVDGPRLNTVGEVEKVSQVRDLIQNSIDWNCEVKTLYRNNNLGCRRAVSSAITWFFEHEEEGIVLEDDCLPNPTFFRFCQELLHKYRFDSRVMMISGNNFQYSRKRTNYSYYFSRYSHIWGWATWRRAWKLYDKDLSYWRELQQGDYLADIFRGDEYAIPSWEKIFRTVYAGNIDTWDYIWTLSSWMQNGLSITPNLNLVSNIGFGINATHTKADAGVQANMTSHAMEFPLNHPPFVIRDTRADSFTERHILKHTVLQRRYGWLTTNVNRFKQFILREKTSLDN